MSETTQTDLVVIGGGPGGYTAAFFAADNGLNVTIIERHVNLGGVCLNVGCIPSKALLHVASVKEQALQAHSYGIPFSEPKIDIDKIRAYKNSIINKMSTGLNQLSKMRQVKVIKGTARFLSANELEVVQDKTTKKIVFKNVIIATGSKSIMPKNLVADNKLVMDSTLALEVNDIPKKLLIVGGGVIGLEMGSCYSAFGSEITVIEALDDILPGVDSDLTAVLKKKINKSFANIHTKTLVEKIVKKGKGLAVTYTNSTGKSQSIDVDKVLLSIGRRPRSDNLGLENTNIKVSDKGFIEVDKQMKTSATNIYAIGDVVGNPMLAHKASSEARVAVEVILGKKSVWDKKCIPAVVYTEPEIAWAGLTETEAKEKGITYSVGSFPWAASGRASALGLGLGLGLGNSNGLTKLLYHQEDHRILGIGIAGLNAGELIAEGCLAIEMGAVMEDIANTIHAHPTLSETIMESAESAHGMATHIYSPKK